MERIGVDFNTMNQDIWSEERRVRIPTGEVRLFFRPGMRVLVYDEELEVEAVLEFDEQHAVWWARPDWSTRRDLPFP